MWDSPHFRIFLHVGHIVKFPNPIPIGLGNLILCPTWRKILMWGDSPHFRIFLHVGHKIKFPNPIPIGLGIDFVPT